MKRHPFSFVFFAARISLLMLVVVAYEQNAWGQLTKIENKLPTTGLLKVNNSLQGFGIDAIGPEPPSFEDELRNLLLNEGADKARSLNDAKRGAIFIKNKSEREIVGLALVWAIPTPGGREHMTPWRRSSTGPLVGVAQLHPALTGKWSLVNVGATQLFSYTDVEVLEGGRKQWHGDRFTPTAVTIDGVIFEDGTFVGPNQSFYFEEISAEVKAKLDFLTRINASKRAGIGASQIIDQFLSATPEHRPTYPNGTQTARFRSAEDAFEYFYLETMVAVRKLIDLNRKTNVSDESILNVLTRPKPEDFKTLRRIS